MAMRATIWADRPLDGTGVQLIDPRMQQPLAVWVNGCVERFCATRPEAEEALAEALQEVAWGLRNNEEED